MKQGFRSLNPKASGSKKKPLVVPYQKVTEVGRGAGGRLKRRFQNWGYFSVLQNTLEGFRGNF